MCSLKAPEDFFFLDTIQTLTNDNNRHIVTPNYGPDFIDVQISYYSSFSSNVYANKAAFTLALAYVFYYNKHTFNPDVISCEKWFDAATNSQYLLQLVRSCDEDRNGYSSFWARLAQDPLASDEQRSEFYKNYSKQYWAMLDTASTWQSDPSRVLAVYARGPPPPLPSRLTTA